MREEAGCKPTIEECRKVLESLVRVDTCQPEGNEGKLADLIWIRWHAVSRTAGPIRRIRQR